MALRGSRWISWPLICLEQRALGPLHFHVGNSFFLLRPCLWVRAFEHSNRSAFRLSAEMGFARTCQNLRTRNRAHSIELLVSVLVSSSVDRPWWDRIEMGVAFWCCHWEQFFSFTPTLHQQTYSHWVKLVGRAIALDLLYLWFLRVSLTSHNLFVESKFSGRSWSNLV